MNKEQKIKPLTEEEKEFLKPYIKEWLKDEWRRNNKKYKRNDSIFRQYYL